MGTLAPGEWEESEWGSNATVRPDPRPVWQKSGEPRPRLPPKPKDWNDIVWRSKKQGERNPESTTTTTTKRPSKNRLGDSHIFGGGGSTREQLRLEDVKESATTTSTTTSTTTTTTTRKPIVVKDRFGQTAHAWGSEPTKQEPSDSKNKRVSTSENRQEAIVQRTTRKSRPSKKKRTTKRPNQFGFGSNDFALVDTGGAKVDLDRLIRTTSAPTSTSTTTTEAEDQRPNWGHTSRLSSPRPSSSRPTTANNRQDDKPNWG